MITRTGIIKIIKDKIKELLNDRNWSANHLAEEVEISAAAITNWYKRNTAPSLDALISICIGCKLPLSDFFNISGKRIELTEMQEELLSEWDLLHKQQKEDLLTHIKNTNAIFKNLNRPI